MKRKRYKKKKKAELTPAQIYGRGILRAEHVADVLGVLTLLLAIAFYYLGISEITVPEKSYTPFLAYIFPALEDTDQITVCASQMMVGALLVLLGIMIMFRTRLHRLN